MPSTITLPTWFVAIAAVLAVIGLLDRLLIPTVRWAVRRRANRAIEKLNQSLQLQIQPFKLTKRQVLIDRLLYDPEVLTAVEAHANETSQPREVAMAQAMRYAREIVPSFSAYTYFRIGTRAARGLSRMLYRVRLGFSNDAALGNVPSDSAVVFVMNHRSNMDYVLVTYMAATSSALSYAVGEWAQIVLLRSLIRSMGAYFIRRESRNQLYRRILARYVSMATEAGVTQAVFPEGGLSRDGTLRPPKLGLLSYMVSRFDPNSGRDVVFIPVGLNYDRVLEDRLLVGAKTEAGTPGRFKFSPLALIGFIANDIWLRVTGRWHRNGYACVSFGEPVSLRSYLKQHQQDLRVLGEEARAQAITDLGQHLMTAVGKVIPALPVSLVTTALLEAGGGPISEFELNGRVYGLMERLEARGAYIHLPRDSREYAVGVGVRTLVMRHIVIREGDQLRLNADDIAIARYYANAIAHLLA